MSAVLSATPEARLRSFGQLASGRQTSCVRLEQGDLAVEILDYGAILKSVELRHGSRRTSLVLGYDSIAAYEQDRAYLGALIGRCANRIENAVLRLPGGTSHVTPNATPHHLHGGRLGFGKALWSIARLEKSPVPHLVLLHQSEHGTEGYPGTINVEASFELWPENRLRVALTAKSDRASVVNLTSHPYFNLSGDVSAPILDHKLSVSGNAVLPVRSDMIPTGDLLDVTGTPFDFRQPAGIGDRLSLEHPQLRVAGGFDHNWVLDCPARPAAVLTCPASGLQLELETNQPGLQFYSGNSLGRSSCWSFRDRCGLCLEPQGFPNAVNEPRFPSVVLLPGQTYRHVTTYQFTALR